MLLAVTGSDDKQVKLWDVASHQSLHTFYDHNEYVTYVVPIFIFISLFIFIFIFLFIFILFLFLFPFLLSYSFPYSFYFIFFRFFLTLYSQAARNVNRSNLYTLHVNISIVDFLYARIPFMFYVLFLFSILNDLCHMRLKICFTQSTSSSFPIDVFLICDSPFSTSVIKKNFL